MEEVKSDGLDGSTPSEVDDCNVVGEQSTQEKEVLQQTLSEPEPRRVESDSVEGFDDEDLRDDVLGKVEVKDEFEEDFDDDDYYFPGLTNDDLFTDYSSNEIGISPLIFKYLSIEQQSLIRSRMIEPKNQIYGDEKSLKSSIDELNKTKCWRTLADFTKRQILRVNPTQTRLILKVWTFNLSELIFIYKTTEHFYHCTNDDRTGSLKSRRSFSKNSKVFREILPFEILLLRIRLIGILNLDDHLDNLKTIDGLNELLESCNQTAWYYDSLPKTKKSIEKSRLWIRRAKELRIYQAAVFSSTNKQSLPISILGSDQMHRTKKKLLKRHSKSLNTGGEPEVESRRKFVNDPNLAIKLLRSVSVQGDDPELDGFIRDHEIKVLIQSGDLNRLESMISSNPFNHPIDTTGSSSDIDSDLFSIDRRSNLLNRVLQLMATSDYNAAIDLSQPILKRAFEPSLHSNDKDDGYLDVIILNNLAICYLYVGNLNQAFKIMKLLIKRITDLYSKKRWQQEVVELKPKDKLNENDDERIELKELKALNCLIFNFTTILELSYGSNRSIESLKVRLIEKLFRVENLKRDEVEKFNDNSIESVDQIKFNDDDDDDDDDDGYGFEVDEIFNQSFKLSL
ncbi:expressed protein [Phakopsora pachyrhizi]|uniref:Expressed protein n=1 Tax=Phakopsora pachyrhizi TaxID=170000 RepID=A0AAV0BDJ0_PHAPC|nr:expressed protein [Phakopsora pachyrhizi]